MTSASDAFEGGGHGLHGRTKEHWSHPRSWFGKSITIRIGSIAEGSKVAFNEVKTVALQRELKLDGWKVDVETSLIAPARSVALVRDGVVVANSTYDKLSTRSEVLRVARIVSSFFSLR